MIVPVSITGTDKCPYAGMTLAIDGTQELDGTLHLVLAKSSYIASNIMSDVKSSLGIAGGLGNETTPVYVDNTGTFKACTGGGEVSECVVLRCNFGVPTPVYPDKNKMIDAILSNKTVVLFNNEGTSGGITVYYFSEFSNAAGGTYKFRPLTGSTVIAYTGSSGWSRT
jgi:hypothetical protein